MRAVEKLDRSRTFEVGAFGRTWPTTTSIAPLRATCARPSAALVVLVLVFGSVVAALVPLALGLVSTAVALELAALLGRVFELSVFVSNIVAAMGLALGIDYALFVVSRYREERARRYEREAAVESAGAHATHAVVVSGTAVAIALSSMVLVPDRVLRSLAAGAAIVTAVAVLAALTLLPALLGVLGDRVNAIAVPVLGEGGVPSPRALVRFGERRAHPRRDPAIPTPFRSGTASAASSTASRRTRSSSGRRACGRRAA